ncbi:MAG: GAF domain-containing protein [Alphaproteobacteria bacterium]|nr:GAF domain-containing protein [Alphaproteobacteria bacterium]
MRVRFFGTRGSIATPGPSTVRYGGNTSCVEVVSDGGTRIVLDMGTGAAILGRALVGAGEAGRGHILISHTHWDHIQGLPFFVPLFQPGNRWDIYAPRGLAQSLRETLAGQMQYEYFPVQLEALGATIRYHELVEGRFQVGDVTVTTHYLNHPALALGYRLEADGVSVVYACDHEPYARDLATAPDALARGAVEGEDRHHVAFLAGADLVIHDAQYLAIEYPNRIGWGHSTVEYAVAAARAAGVKRLALTHHDPTREDDALDAVRARLEAARAPDDPEILIAAEGETIMLRAPPRAAPAEPVAMPQPAESALATGSVLLVFDDAGRRERLAALLHTEHVGALAASLDEAAAVTARERPTVVLIQDTGDTRAAALARTMRHAMPSGCPAIVLVTADERAPLADGPFTGCLVEPYTDSYARARLRAWQLGSACRWERAQRVPEEEQRLATLRALGLLDTPEEERFDRITRLAGAVFDVPVALISLVDRDRQFFKSHCGLSIRESPRDESFCAHAVYSRAPLIVPDARLDDRFADNPAVAGPASLRFYAGHPLELADGTCIGTLCIADTRPRAFGEADVDRLADLADLVTREIERAGG